MRLEIEFSGRCVILPEILIGTLVIRNDSKTKVRWAENVFIGSIYLLRYFVLSSEMKVTRPNYERAKAYLTTEGRPLELSLFRWVFEDAPSEIVLDALARHQHANGGFFGMGEGPGEIPSPMGTTVAFQYLTDFDAEGEDLKTWKSIWTLESLRVVLRAYNKIEGC